LDVVLVVLLNERISDFSSCCRVIEVRGSMTQSSFHYMNDGSTVANTILTLLLVLWVLALVTTTPQSCN